MHSLLILAVIYQTVFCATEDVKCTSQFDYEHRLLYKLIKIEEDVKDFRNVITKLKAIQIQTETEQTQKLEKTLDDFKKNTGVQLSEAAENSRKELEHIKDALDYLNKTFQNVQKHVEDTNGNFNRPAIGFSVQKPIAGIDRPGEITFNTTITNTGDGFDETTGRFTCQTPGYYYFIVVLLKRYAYDGDINCNVYINSDIAAYVYTNPSLAKLKFIKNRYTREGSYSAVNSAFVHLSKGDTVYLGACSKLYSMDIRSSFSGFLVTAD